MKEKNNVFEGLFDDLQWEEFKEVFPMFFDILGKITKKEESDEIK